MSQKYTINGADLISALKNALVFLLPIAIANTGVISAFLIANGISGTTIAIGTSLFIHLAEKFVAGEPITLNTVAQEIVQATEPTPTVVTVP
jgi:hypothetical protein